MANRLSFERIRFYEQYIASGVKVGSWSDGPKRLVENAAILYQ